MKYIWLLVIEIGYNSGLNRMEVIFFDYKGSAEVGMLGLIWEVDLGFFCFFFSLL